MSAHLSSCWCPCHTGAQPWPACSCGGVHAPSDRVGDFCAPLWETPWGCPHCHPDNPVAGLDHGRPVAEAPFARLPAGARNHMRRYLQAERRANRLRGQLAAAVESKETHLRGLLALGISERKLAAMVGLSRRRVRVLAGGAAEEQRS